MNDMKKEQEREELHRAIWAIADNLRGAVDGWDFKNYVLGTMFYRYISENLTAYINKGEIEAGNTDFDYAKLSDEEAEEARADLVQEKGFFILPSELFCNVRAKAMLDDNLNETLERVFNNIEESAKGGASENSFAGLFDDFDVNSNKLGSTVAKRNAGNVTEEKESELEEYVEYAKIVMGVLGHLVFEPLVQNRTIGNTVHVENDDYMEFSMEQKMQNTGMTVKAKCKRSSEGYIVLRGSIINSKTNDKTCSGVAKKARETAKIDENNMLLEDVLFSSPSAASMFVTGASSNAWLDVTVPQSYNIYDAAVDFGKSLCKSLDRLSASSVDVALIYIPKEYEPLTGYVDDNENFDLHDYVKAYAAQRNIATQFVREKTLESDMNCQIMWALSLAIYVKSSRIPWVVSGINNETAFAGIGYSLNRTGSNSNVVVGCSHIYSADGQGMKYKLSKIDDCTFDHKKNPYLSEDEAYRLGLNIKELFYKSFSEMPKRVVIHKRTPFRRDEIKGLVTSLSSAGIKDIDLLEITLEDDLKCFEFTRNMDAIDGFPVRRGLCFPLNDNTMYLYTHGIAPSVRNPNYRYIQGGKTIPLPLKIVKHHGNGTLPQIATEILGLSKMNWNSFGLYSKLPCTIDSSNEIARIGRLLSQYEGAIYEYRYFM